MDILPPSDTLNLKEYLLSYIDSVNTSLYTNDLYNIYSLSL